MALYIDANKLVKESEYYGTGRDVEVYLHYHGAADVIPKREADKARQEAYERGKRELAHNLYVKIYNEIIEARNSNFKAIKEREIKHNVNRYEDTFCYYCDGKIHALDGIMYFIDGLIKEYMEGDIND